MTRNLDLLWFLKTVDLAQRYDEVASREGTVIQNEKLISADLSDLGITSIPNTAFQECRALRKIDLSVNRIGSVEKGTFRSLKNLEELELQGNRLQSLPGQLFHSENNLLKIDLSGNQLNAVPKAVHHCRKLRELSIANNEIKLFSRDEFAAFTHLEVLDLHGNTLENTNFNMTLPSSLRILNLSEMGLEILETNSFSGLYNLEELNLSSNRLNEISRGLFSHLPKLKILWLSNNFLKEIPEDVSFCKDLSHLIVSSNYLEKLPDLSGFPKLRYLVAMDNRLKFVDFEMLNYTDLEEVWLANNDLLGDLSVNLFGKEALSQFSEKQKHQIEALAKIQRLLQSLDLNKSPKAILEREKTRVLDGELKALDLSNLGIKTLEISENVLDVIKNLRLMDLSGNSIEQVTPDALNRMNQLKILILQNNPLKNLPENFISLTPHLHELYLKDTLLPSCWRRNFIDEFDLEEFREYFDENRKAFQQLHQALSDAGLNSQRVISDPETIIANGKVTAIRIETQTVTSLDILTLQAFPHLKRLVLKGLGLRDIDLVNDSLEFLDLSTNSLKSVKIAGKSLRVLMVHDNLISEINLKTPILQILELKGNKLSEIGFLSSLENLEELDMSFNKLEFLGEVRSNSLENLNLEGNPIAHITENFVVNLPRLKYINLKNTRLHPSLAKVFEGRNLIIETFS